MCPKMHLGVILFMLMTRLAQAQPGVGDNSLESVGVSSDASQAEKKGFFPDRDLEDVTTTTTTTTTSTTTLPPSIQEQTKATKEPEPQEDKSTEPTPLTPDADYKAMIEEKRSRELNKLKQQLLLIYSPMYNNRPCNYTLYKQKMPQFWKAFKSGTVSKTEQREFAKQFWDISVEFKHNENQKIVVGNCEDKQDKHDGCLVTRRQQRMREMDMCFNGGLMECSEKTQTCVCLDIPGIKTVRVDPDTGREDENGKACFVEAGQQCMISHFGMQPIILPCVDKNLCSTYSQDCVEPDGDWRKSHKHISSKGEETVHVLVNDTGDDFD